MTAIERKRAHHTHLERELLARDVRIANLEQQVRDLQHLRVRFDAAQHQAEVWRVRAGRLAVALQLLDVDLPPGVGDCVLCRDRAEVEAGNIYDLCASCEASLSALEDARAKVSAYPLPPLDVAKWAVGRIRRKLGSIP